MKKEGKTSGCRLAANEKNTDILVRMIVNDQRAASFSLAFFLLFLTYTTIDLK
jgi:hypothetical protein